MSDDMCGATTNTGFAVVTCYLLDGHNGQHDDGSYSWNSVQPLQERNRCEAVTAVEEGCNVQCQEPIGHPAPHHRNGTWTWPFAERRTVSEREQQWAQRLDDAGGNRDELILRLFDRIEQLEQTSAGGAAVDHMFAARDRSLERLADGLGEVEKRMTRLEQAQVYGPGPHDLIALRASIENHINRALTEFGGGLGLILDGMRDVLTKHISTNTTAVLAQLAPAPPRVICDQPDLTATLRCEEGLNHGGRHRNGTSSWPNPCGAVNPSLGVSCVMVKGHTTEHRSERGSVGFGRARWVDDQEQWRDIGVATPVESDGAQTERASGSPAAVRCPERFREGQCLGYAGHDGECSAIQGGEHLEDPEEFGHTSYASLDYLNRHGAPDEPEPFTETAEDRSSDGTPIEPGDPSEDNYPEQNFHS